MWCQIRIYPYELKRVSLWYNDTEKSQSSEDPTAALLKTPKGK